MTVTHTNVPNERKKNMNYYIGEPGSTGRYFDDFDDFVSALRDLADTYKTEGNETFEVEVIRD